MEGESSNADDIFESLLNSRAVETGLVEDLEDCRIFVEGVDKDKVSDMTTNIIRKYLIEYTQQQCDLWGIATTPDVPSGFFWSRSDREWQNVHTRMLIVTNKKLLLVPKAITSFKLGYTPQRYHQHFVLNFLQHEHLRLNTALVKHTRRRDGSTRSYVTKTDLKARVAPLSKEFLRRFTEDHPEVFKDFRQRTAATVQAPNGEELAGLELEGVVDHLIAELQATPSGTANATKYHRLAVGILELLFYPNLTCPQVEREIHEGRKRIDITFDNAATKGFFFRLHMTYRIPCQFIFSECKNYSEDPTNPELDQLSGGFALNRGKFGLLLCRTISDLSLFMARCTDTYRDDRGLIIPLVDDDLLTLLAEGRKKNDAAVEQFLSDRYRSIALR